MILIVTKNTNKAILIIGLGLVGTSICRKILTQIETNNIISYKINWSDYNYFIEILKDVSLVLKKENIQDIHIVWSAGKSGFLTPEENCQSEYVFFKEVVLKMSIVFSIFKVFFHFISSAGGLYEGRINISNSTSFNLLRPYAFLKFDQENLIKSLFSNPQIYRASNIYGFVKEKETRSGLITTLVKNTLKDRVTTIYGDDSTLRDYIYVDDLANIVLSNIKFNSNTLKHEFVVSGKPSSIYEIRLLVRKTIGKEPMIKFVKKVSDLPITFSKNVALDNPTSLTNGIELVKNNFFFNNN